MDAGSSPYWLSFAVKYEGGPGDIQSVMIRQVSNEQTPGTTPRKSPLQFVCKFFLWKAWNSYVTLTSILTTLVAGWLGSCACVCSLVATSGSQCNTTGVRVGCWSTTLDNLSKVLSTFRSLPSSMAILSSHGMQFQITSNPEQPTIQLCSSYIKSPPKKPKK